MTFFGMVLSFVVVNPALALSGVELDRAQYKAVVDALVDQQRIHSDESVRGIFFVRPNHGGSTFAVHLVDPAGTCTQETADVRPVGEKIQVSFYRRPRGKC